MHFQPIEIVTWTSNTIDPSANTRVLLLHNPKLHCLNDVKLPEQREWRIGGMYQLEQRREDMNQGGRQTKEPTHTHLLKDNNKKEQVMAEQWRQILCQDLQKGSWRWLLDGELWGPWGRVQPRSRWDGVWVGEWDGMSTLTMTRVDPWSEWCW